MSTASEGYLSESAHYAKTTLVLLVTVLGLSVGAEVESQECLRNTLEPTILRSAVWDGESIYLTDARNSRILRVALRSDGKVAINTNPDTDLKPVAAAKQTDGGFIQVITAGSPRLPREILWLDAALKERGRTELELPDEIGLSLAKTKEKWENRVLALYEWIALGDTIFAYGLLGDSSSPDDLAYGFFTHQVRSPGSYNVVPKARVVLYLPDFEYYVLGLPYMAAIGDVVYFMTLQNFPQLFKYDSRQPSNGPMRMGVIGEIPLFDTPVPPIGNSTPLADVDNETFPVGLYASDSFLYVLYRKPTAVGGKKIEWELIKLVPAANEVRSLGGVALPIRPKARHVTLLRLPEDSVWAAFEIGASPDGVTRGDVLSMIRMPDGWIDPENPRSPLRVKTVHTDFCRLVD